MGLLCGGLEHEVHMVGIRIQCTVVVAGKGMEEPRVTLGEPLGTESGHTIGTRGTREREREREMEEEVLSMSGARNSIIPLRRIRGKRGGGVAFRVQHGKGGKVKGKKKGKNCHSYDIQRPNKKNMQTLFLLLFFL